MFIIIKDTLSIPISASNY